MKQYFWPDTWASDLLIVFVMFSLMLFLCVDMIKEYLEERKKITKTQNKK